MMKGSILSAAAAVLLLGAVTGSYSYAQTAQAVSKSQLTVGQKYYISADTLNVRSSNSTTESNIVGKLSRNDVVELYNVLNEATPLVQVKIVKSSSISANAAPELFVSKDYLSEKALADSASGPASKYFVIQNIATEKTRVYERCTVSPGCPHKMIMETDTVVGRPEEGTDDDPDAFKTWVGHGRISEWVKFYQDGLGFYPRWYTPGQDIKTIPSPMSGGISLLMGANKWLVRNSQGKKSTYGAFGWYAAKLSPESEVSYQWIHGTIGWGKDGAKPIEVTRGKMINLFSNPGSHGCTRLENRAVAYMRSLLPVGTDVYRIYAKETSRERAPFSRYADSRSPLRWEYILLTNGAAQSGGLTADAATIRSQGISVVPGVNLLEQGYYDVNRYPTIVGIDYSYAASSGKSGDRYSIDRKNKGSSNFRGYFLVDEGRLMNYAHPSYQKTNGAVRTGGMADFRNSVPEFLTAQ